MSQSLPAVTCSEIHRVDITGELALELEDLFVGHGDRVPQIDYRYLNELLAGSNRLFVARLDGKLVGACLILSVKSLESSMSATELVVHPDYRGRAIAADLHRFAAAAHAVTAPTRRSFEPWGNVVGP
ncbi:GNAT family N-acetyltransferase [Candidatus Saccharibacteria bacterium]|nr:GNAT family N-acetyltransferase [Candidatus Saccharibacteria bacterium]